MIFLFLSLVFLEPRSIFGSSASSLGFSVTFTNKKILETFINGTEKSKNSRLCGLACLSRYFCRSFNFQWRSHYCEFLITDSRLLGQEHLLGKSRKEPNWVFCLEWLFFDLPLSFLNYNHWQIEIFVIKLWIVALLCFANYLYWTIEFDFFPYGYKTNEQ